MSYIFGFDPGRDGAVAWIDPVTLELVGVAEAGSADEATPGRLYELFKTAQLVVVERPLAYPGVPAQSQMILTESYGAAVAAARIAGATVITPTASQWKRSVGVTSVKKTSVDEAVRLFKIEGRAPRHDKCEAMLLAYYGWQQGGHYG